MMQTEAIACRWSFGGCRPEAPGSSTGCLHPVRRRWDQEPYPQEGGYLGVKGACTAGLISGKEKGAGTTLEEVPAPLRVGERN